MNFYPDDPIRLADGGRIPSLDPANRTHLRLVDLSDAEYLAELRSRSDVSRHLSPGDFSPNSQRDWITGYKRREARGQEYYFLLVSDGERKGTVRLYDFRCVAGSVSFCFGSWIVAPPRTPGLTTYAFTMALEIGFDQLKFPMCHFDVRRENETAIAFYERAGAVRTGSDEVDFYYTLSAADFEAFRRRSTPQMKTHRILRMS